MTEAPDRIWAMASDDGWMAPYCGRAPYPDATEYVRADKVQALVEAAQLAEKQLEAFGGDGLASGLTAALAAFTDGGAQG